jgi:eukaryotic-like serine/threonine-protein kinase
MESQPIAGNRTTEVVNGDLSATSGVAPESEPGFVGNVAGSFVGPYQLVRLIGAGGMGQVWLAEQKHPVQRRVAIKLIKAGMDTQEVIARFDSERQALAVMDHPAIAKVFDAGSTPEGRPYFAMEYVAGLPITTYCDEHRLTLRQRLELFMLVCEGVQHAHQKAIIHRDLKPSNILVQELDGKATPRIIDFGLAKAMSQLGGETMLTHVGSVMGTLGYMSPEQAEGSEDIDTRTDVYSLGVVFYELLVGALPLDFKKLANDEALRRLREQDALKPSTKLRGLGGESKIAAEKRGAELAVVTRQLQGDLDSIALKALEKDRARRYATPLEFAADAGRYLRNEPVTAHPASVAYRAKKYVRRHRVGVAAAAAAALLLVGFAVAQSVELRDIRRQRDRADRIARFMTGMFKVSNPSEARGNAVTAREILDKASQQIGTGLNNDPALQAQLMETMAQTYAGLGLYARGRDLTEHALALEKPLLGARNRTTLATERDLARLIRAQGHPADAEKMLRETVAVQTKVLGANDPDTLATMNELGYALINEARHAEGDALFRQALAGQMRVLGPDNPATQSTMLDLAENLTSEGQYAEADKLYDELVAAQRRTLGPDHPTTLLSMSHQAENLSQGGHYPEAEKVYRQVVASQERVLGPEHPQTLRSKGMLAFTLMYEGKYAEADKLQNEVIAVKTRVLGPAAVSTLQSREFEAVGLGREGRYADGEKMFLDVIKTADEANEPATADEAWYNFASMAADAGRKDEAFTYLDHAIARGLVSPEEVANDPELKALHGDRRLDAAIAKARQVTGAK